MSDDNPTRSGNRPLNRRTALKTIGTGVLSSAAVGTNVVVDVASASHTEPYDTPERTTPEDDNGNVFADIRSSVNGPKQVEDDVSSINMATAIPIGYNEDEWSGIPKSAKNVHLRLEEEQTPTNGDWTPQHVEVRKQGDSDDAHTKYLDYAIDVAWALATWYTGVPAPNPADLLLDNDNTTLDVGSNYIDLTYNEIGDSWEGAGMNWEIDFYMHDGGVPTGTWSWNLICEGDVGYYNVGGGESGFNKIGEFWDYHNISVDVVENA